MKTHKTIRKKSFSAFLFKASVLVVGFIIAFSHSGNGILTAQEPQVEPTISIGDASVIEGNSVLGKRMVFPVTLSGSSASTVTVNYTTVNGTAHAGGSTDFSNTELINIFDGSSEDPTPSAPYPSTIDIASAGTITRLSVTLFGYQHGWPGDVDILLVGPLGQKVLLMSDVGETYDPVPPGVNITFDDAAESMPATIPVSGTYKPTNAFGLFGVEPDTFPSPAPSGPYGSSLSVFNGTNPNGTWKLYVVDDSLGEAGGIYGWGLTLTATGGPPTLGDYVTKVGALSIPPGVTSVSLTVPVTGDTVNEGNEAFSVVLSSPVNATIADGTGLGTIVDDDSANPPLGSGAQDMLLDLGSSGLWTRNNNTSWGFVHTFNAAQSVLGDFDGNGQDDVIADFTPACGCGIWAKFNGTTWLQIHPGSVVALTAADVDGNGISDIVVNFGSGGGVWAYLNLANWVLINTGNPTSVLTGDLDGDGRAEVIINFNPGGLYKWSLNGGLVSVHSLGAASLAVGDLDGVGGEELVVGFDLYGTYYLSGSTWTYFHSRTPARMAVADVDNNGKGDIAINFAGFGVWLYKDLTTWTQLHAMDVSVLTAGDFDNDGKSDLLMSFPGFGTYEWLNNSSWLFVHPLNPDQASVGRVD